MRGVSPTLYDKKMTMKKSFNGINKPRIRKHAAGYIFAFVHAAVIYGNG